MKNVKQKVIIAFATVITCLIAINIGNTSSKYVEARSIPIVDSLEGRAIVTMADTFSGLASGTIDDPYILSSQADLEAFRASCTSSNNYATKFVVLGADIQLSLPSATTGWGPIANFRGTFDGRGHTISGLWVNGTTNNQGLFGLLGVGATIKNLSVQVEDRGIKGAQQIGALAGRQSGGLIENCHISGNATIQGTSSRVGGLVGVQDGGTIDDCSVSNVTIKSENNGTYQDGVGGIVGIHGTAYTESITECRAINVTVEGNSKIGGIIGVSNDPVTNCVVSNGIIRGHAARVGGIIGSQEGGSLVDSSANKTTIKSTSTASIDQNAVGGLVGFQLAITCTINRCMATSITVKGGTGVGGIAGVGSGKIEHCEVTSANGVQSTITGSLSETSYGTGGISGTQNRLAGIINNCKVKGSSISGKNTTGGISGHTTGTLTNCSITSLSGFPMTVTGQQYTGGVCGYYYNETGGTMEACNVKGATVSGTTMVGGVCGNLQKTNLKGSTVSGEGGVLTIVSGTGDQIGGVVGLCNGDQNVKITDCQAEVSVSGNEKVGGFVGWAQKGTIDFCYSSGNVTGTKTIGGFAGDASCAVEKCFFVGQANGTTNVGGFAGCTSQVAASPSPAVTDCYDICYVKGTSDVGGFAGVIFAIDMIDCYSAAVVESTNQQACGAFVGRTDDTATHLNFTDCFYDEDIAGQADIVSNGSINVAGKTTVEMLEQLTFTGWDFAGVWSINEDKSYPYFTRWKNNAQANNNLISGLNYTYAGKAGSISFAESNKVAAKVLYGTSEAIHYTGVKGNADYVLKLLPSSLPTLEQEYPLTMLGISYSAGIGAPYWGGFIRKMQQETIDGDKNNHATQPSTQTGDRFNMMLWVVLLTVAAATIIGILSMEGRLRRK